MLEELFQDLKERVRTALSLLIFDRLPEHPLARERRLRVEEANRDLRFFQGNWRELQELSRFIDAADRAAGGPESFAFPVADQWASYGSMLRK